MMVDWEQYYRNQIISGIEDFLLFEKVSVEI